MKEKLLDKVLLYRQDLTLEEVVKKIDANSDGFIALVDDFKRLVGIITDGDIRRAFLRKETNVDKIINRKPQTLSVKIPFDRVINFLKRKKLRLVPIIDEKNVLVNLISLDDLEFEEFEETVIIMAGGMGTRLGELTKDTPKPMLKVGEKPILEHIINNFQNSGFKKFSISLNYRADIIKDYFKRGEDIGADISYIEEDKPLGTAGAISLLEDKLKSDDIIVINGDVLSNINYANLIKYHRSHNADITVCSKEYCLNIPYAVFETDQLETLVSFKEKPNINFWVNSGIYVLNRRVLPLIPKDTFYNMTDLLEVAIKNNKLIKVYKMKDYWVDIGHLQDYEKAIKEF